MQEKKKKRRFLEKRTLYIKNIKITFVPIFLITLAAFAVLFVWVVGWWLENYVLPIVLLLIMVLVWWLVMRLYATKGKVEILIDRLKGLFKIAMVLIWIYSGFTYLSYLWSLISGTSPIPFPWNILGAIFGAVLMLLFTMAMAFVVGT